MTNDKKFLDDVSKIATSTFASMVNMKNEFSNIVKEQIKSTLKGMDFVTRNEFNALKRLTSEIKMELDNNKLGGQTMKKKAAKKVVKKVAAKKPAKKAKSKKK
jgi:BMFP domain-containing protein YqiC